MTIDIQELLLNPKLEVPKTFSNLESAKKMIGRNWDLGTYSEHTHSISDGIVEFIYEYDWLDCIIIQYHRIIIYNNVHFLNSFLFKMNRDTFCDFLIKNDIAFKIVEIHNDGWTYVFTETNVVISFSVKQQLLANLTKYNRSELCLIHDSPASTSL